VRPHPAAASEGESYWSTPTEELLARLRTNAAGLASITADDRLREHGENRLRLAERGPIAAAILGQLRNPLLWLLLFATVTSAALGELTDALVVASILLLGSLVSVLQDARAGRALVQLRERVALRSRVIRDGVEREVPAVRIVPGDVIVLSAGTLIPADAVLLDCRDLYVSEAALTGESLSVQKRVGSVPEDAELSERSNVVHMGTNVRSGTGRAVVVATGATTTFGRVAGRLAVKPPATDFEHGLRRFGYVLLTAMLVLVFVVFGASAWQRHPPIDSLLFAIALSVGLAPEMLPAILATMLSRGARRLAARGVLVRRLEAIENLGNMDVLCTDKTGTLTEGEVRLQAALDPSGRPSDLVARLAYWNAALQSGIANPLDRAIVESNGEAADMPAKVDELPFDFTRRRLSVLVRPQNAESLLVTKGAFEAMLAVCTTVRDGGVVRPLAPEDQVRLHGMAEQWSADGVRVLAVATRAWNGAAPIDRDVERELVFEGFLTFLDPPKEGVTQAILDLEELAVSVKIVSGDHHHVVRHLADRVGLKTDRVITGKQLASMRAEALWHVVEEVDLFAEVDPAQKERILLALKKRGHVVGFMGDGVNDAPAMHVADVGISVEGATDVAREAADFVLLRRDLSTVRDGVREGRATNANTLKYLLTTESANLGNMISMAAASLFLPFLPLLAQQVLLNNLLSDVPSATLSADRVDPELVLRPQRWNITFMWRFMVAFGLISAIFDGLTFAVLTAVLHTTPMEFRTAWFSVSLLTELFVLFSLRTRRWAWKSRPHPALVASTVAVAVLGVVIPMSPLRGVLGFAELSNELWAGVFGVTAAYVVTVELCKRPLLRLIARPPRPRRGVVGVAA